MIDDLLLCILWLIALAALFALAGCIHDSFWGDE